VGQTNFAP